MADGTSPHVAHVGVDGSASMYSQSCKDSTFQQSPTPCIAPPLMRSDGLPINTPTRPARDAENDSRRARALSRSSSAPSMKHRIAQVKHQDHNIDSLNQGTAGIDGSTRHSNSSVKHLTCFWWKEKGSCRFKDDECLYAHHDTGHYTDPPRQLVPGEPALAGRKLDRAMRNLAFAAHRSSGSLNSMAGSQYPSRPSTPVVNTEAGYPTFNTSSPMVSPLSMSMQPQCGNDVDVARLNGDNQFLRTLVDQNSREKAIFINTIENLQAENRGLKGEVEGLRMAQEQLLAEREGLHNRINQLENGQAQNLGPVRSVSSPFGAIGRGRVNTETRYLGGLLSEE